MWGLSPFNFLSFIHGGQPQMIKQDFHVCPSFPEKSDIWVQAKVDAGTGGVAVAFALVMLRN